MPTNGYAYDRGYRTAVPPAFVDTLLQGSNTVYSSCNWTSGGDVIVAYITAADVVIINLNDSVQVGYATLAGGFTGGVTYGVVGANTYLYLGRDGTGVYRLDLTAVDMQAANGDLTPGGWAATYTTISAVPIQSNNVKDLAFSEPGPAADDLLAVACLGITVINLTDSTATNITALTDAATRVHFLGESLYWNQGNFINYVADARTAPTVMTATAAGNVGDNFNDNLLSDGWIANAPAGTVLEQNQRLEISVTSAGVEVDSKADRAGYFSGDFEMEVHVTIPAWAALATDGKASRVKLIWYFPHDSWDIVDACREIRRAGGATTHSLVSRKTGEAETVTPYANDDFWLKLARVGTTITASYKTAGGGGYSGFKVWTGCHTSPIHATLQVVLDENPLTQLAYYDSFATNHSTHTAYNMDGTDTVGPPLGNLNDFAISGSVTGAGYNTLAMAYSNGLWLTETRETTPGTTEGLGNSRGGYGNSADYNYNILRGINISSVANSIYATIKDIVAAGSGSVAVGISGTGFELVKLEDDTTWGDFEFDATSDQPMVAGDCDRLDRMAGDVGASGAWFYCCTSGGGWIDPDETPPGDKVLWSRCADSNKVILAWDKPSGADFDHSLLYRKFNSGAYLVLQTDGTWGGASPFSFDDEASSPDGVDFSFYEIGLADGKYTYKLTQVDEANNESAGTVEYVYVGAPTVTSVQVEDWDTGATASTNSRGVIVKIAASSFDGTADAVEHVRIREAGEAWISHAQQIYSSGMEYKFVLQSAGAGTKTVEVVAYSQGGDVSAVVSDDITYTGNEAGALAYVESNMVLAHSFLGDDATAGSTNGNAAFPAANVLDARLGKKWRSTDSTASTLHLDLGANQTLRWIAILGHNFGEFDDAYTPPGDTWDLDLQIAVSGGFYTSKDITHLAINDEQHGNLPIIVNMEGETARSVQVHMNFSGAGEPDHYEVGRVLVACSGNTIQPTTNFRREFVQAAADWSTVRNTPVAAMVANPKRGRAFEVELASFTDAQRGPFVDAMLACGTDKPVLLILKPSILPAWSDAVIQYDNIAYSLPSRNYWCYGTFAATEQAWNVQSTDYGAATIRVDEKVE